jgi:hypothetical protein
MRHAGSLRESLKSTAKKQDFYLNAEKSYKNYFVMLIYVGLRDNICFAIN